MRKSLLAFKVLIFFVGVALLLFGLFVEIGQQKTSLTTDGALIAGLGVITMVGYPWRKTQRYNLILEIVALLVTGGLLLYGFLVMKIDLFASTTWLTGRDEWVLWTFISTFILCAKLGYYFSPP